MQDNIGDGTKREKKHKSYEENGKLKDYINETFYLDYLVANSIENEKFSDDSKNNKEAKNSGNLIFFMIKS